MTYLCERLDGREVDIRCTLPIPAHELGKDMVGVRLCKCRAKPKPPRYLCENQDTIQDYRCIMDWHGADCSLPIYCRCDEFAEEVEPEPEPEPPTPVDDRDPHTTSDDAAITVAADQARQEAKALASFDERVAAWRRKPTELLWGDVETAKRAYAAEFLETMMMRAGAIE